MSRAAACSIKLLDGTFVAAGVIDGFGGHRVDKLFFDLVAAQVWLGDQPCDRAAVPRGVVGDDVGRGDEPHGLDGDEFGVTRSEADAVESPRHAQPRPPAPRASLTRPHSRSR